MLDLVMPCPAYILSRASDVLAANSPGLRLLPGIEEWPRQARNSARYTFLHPRAREVYASWEQVAAETVAQLRAAAGAWPGAADLAAVIGELTVKSEEFIELWRLHDVRNRTNGRKQYRHPSVGPMTLGYEAYTVARSEGHRLIVYQAEPGTPDHDAMLLLSVGTPNREDSGHGAHSRSALRKGG
jgi:hypothetical protein